MTVSKKGANGGNTVSPVQSDVPIHVFELAPGNIQRVLAGEKIGTVISTGEEGGGGGDDR